MYLRARLSNYVRSITRNKPKPTIYARAQDGDRRRSLVTQVSTYFYEVLMLVMVAWWLAGRAGEDMYRLLDRDRCSMVPTVATYGSYRYRFIASRIYR